MTKRLTRKDFEGIDYGTDRMILAASVLRKYQYDSTNGFDYGKEWRRVRDLCIERDQGIDFLTGEVIHGSIFVHHLNELNEYSPESDRYDMDGLICVSRETHQSIHFAGAQGSRSKYRAKKQKVQEVPEWLK